jgi:hypothetical protein
VPANPEVAAPNIFSRYRSQVFITSILIQPLTDLLPTDLVVKISNLFLISLSIAIVLLLMSSINLAQHLDRTPFNGIANQVAEGVPKQCHALFR